MQLLLTGGTGFFGKALLRHFLANGLAADASVVVLSRNPASFLAAYPEFARVCAGHIRTLHSPP